MNLDTCAICQFFLELSVWGKVAMIAGYILMALLLILWERSKARRRVATRSPVLTPNTSIKVTEKLIHTIPTQPSKNNQHDAFGRRRYLLDIFRSNLSKSIVHSKSHNARQKHLKCLHQYLLKHILTIVNTAKRRVNESGKEPSDLKA
jgi:hypothetical protein